jgi:hypothetical protein
MKTKVDKEKERNYQPNQATFVAAPAIHLKDVAPHSKGRYTALGSCNATRKVASVWFMAFMNGQNHSGPFSASKLDCMA